jgi:hypothetical protein
LLHRPDDADDRETLGRIGAEPDTLADRVPMRPKALRELVVDDDDGGRVLPKIRIIED